MDFIFQSYLEVQLWLLGAVSIPAAPLRTTWAGSTVMFCSGSGSWLKYITPGQNSPEGAIAGAKFWNKVAATTRRGSATPTS